MLINVEKSSLFTVDERIEMLQTVTKEYGNVKVGEVSRPAGRLLQAARHPGDRQGAAGVSDFDYELQMAQLNYRLSGVETLFMPTNPEYSFLSSSRVKEIARYGGDVSGLVPDLVHKLLIERLRG